MSNDDQPQGPPVKGSKEGIRGSNKLSRNVGPLLGVADVKRDYLYGIDIKDREGNPLSDESYQVFIENAISHLEHSLDIHVVPERIVEERDYVMNWYSDWGFITLNNYPVIDMIKMEMIYFLDKDNQPEVIQTIPNNWVRMQDHDGMIRLIPNARFPANLQLDNSGNFFPEVLRSTMVPGLWRFTYDAGFADGKVPNIINQAIGLMTAIQAMSIGGIQVFGPGVASESISLDGLSQSINTTNTAQDSAYGPVIHSYKIMLYGEDGKEKTGIMSILRDFYKGQTISII